MKKQMFVILLMLLCVSISKITAQTKDSLSISPSQVKNVYLGLKQGEEAKLKLLLCKESAIELNSIIQSQNDSIQKSGKELLSLNKTLTELQEDRLKKAVKIQQLEDRKTPWYKHPITFTVVGTIFGAWLASR